MVMVEAKAAATEAVRATEVVEVVASEMVAVGLVEEATGLVEVVRVVVVRVVAAAAMAVVGWANDDTERSA